jgi:hypothetical protein
MIVDATPLLFLAGTRFEYWSLNFVVLINCWVFSNAEKNEIQIRPSVSVLCSCNALLHSAMCILHDYIVQCLERIDCH